MRQIGLQGDRMLEVQHLEKVRDGVKGMELANAIDGNGIDEVVIESEGKVYLAYGRGLDIEELRPGMEVTLFGGTHKGTITKVNDEVNSFWEGILDASGAHAVAGSGAVAAGVGLGLFCSKWSLMAMMGGVVLGVAGACLAVAGGGYMLFKGWQAAEGGSIDDYASINKLLDLR